MGNGRFQQARAFAIKAHGDQLYGKLPYVTHLDHVVELLLRAGHEDDSCVVGFLHDVLEDTDTSFEEIFKIFGSDIAYSCDFCTDVKASNRKERKKLTLARQKLMIETRPLWLGIALPAKVADRLGNIQKSRNNVSLFEMYRREHEEFREALYIPKTCDKLWELIEDEWQDQK